MEKIRIGILGYGNLGKGVEKGISNNSDMELVGIFSRRNPEDLDTTAPKFNVEELENFKDKIDVLILCGGSKSDIPSQGPNIAKMFNTVDSYDNHSKIFDYFNEMDKVCKENKTVSIISTGWDPGLFSINRVISEAVLPVGNTYTFWGKGVSQGHSDAVRKIPGVKYAVQYTIPNEEMIAKIHSGEDVEYTGKSAHFRDVYVVLDESGDEEKVRDSIINMEDYFVGYKTQVSFISEDEYMKDHRGIPHGGNVIRLGNTSEDTKAVYGFSLDLGSNPEFTSSVNIAFARACYRYAKEKSFGARSVLDVAPGYLIQKSREELLKTMV